MKETQLEQQRRYAQYERAVKTWLKNAGLTEQVFADHPQVDHIKYLMQFKNKYQSLLNQDYHLRVEFNTYWTWVVEMQKPLQAKSFKKLKNMKRAAAAKTSRTAAQRDKIKQLRQTA